MSEKTETIDCVVVIDDTEVVRALVKRAIERYAPDVYVAEAEDGIYGLSTVQNRFDVGNRNVAVYTDFQMPRLHGVEVIRELKRWYPQVTRIAIASADPSKLKEELSRFSLQLPPEAVYEKPFDGPVLKQLVAYLTGQPTKG